MRMKKETSIRIRITGQHKRVMEQAAAAAGLDLSSWLRALAIKEARRLGVK